VPDEAANTTQGDATGGIIPYKNPPALAAYYCAVFSLVPILGLVLGVPAIVLGVLGLRKRKTNPVIKGVAHAWIGIVLGALTTLAWAALVVLIVANL